MRIAARRRRHVRLDLGRWVAAGLLLLAVGCAETDPRHDATAASGTGSGGGDPRALGVDVVDWPADIPAASTALIELPPQLGGVSGGPFPPRRPVIAQYGDDYHLEVVGPSSQGSALETLDVLFDVSYPRCVGETYAGTIPSRDGTGPDTRGETTPEQRAWFSCRLAPSGRTFMGHAVGWVSGDVGWLVTARTQDEARAFVRALTATVQG